VVSGANPYVLVVAIQQHASPLAGGEAVVQQEVTSDFLSGVRLQRDQLSHSALDFGVD
jgi:hypothetical protein